MEHSGRRRRLLRYCATVLGCACAGYLVFLTLVVHALADPGGKTPPQITEPLPTSNARHDSRLGHDDPSGAPTHRPSTRPASPRAQR